jgi:hypothetical protein
VGFFERFCKAKTARRTTWWLRWGSSGFFPPGGLAKLIGVGLTVTGPGASDGLPLSDWQAEFESSSGISSTVLSLGIPS